MDHLTPLPHHCTMVAQGKGSELDQFGFVRVPDVRL